MERKLFLQMTGFLLHKLHLPAESSPPITEPMPPHYPKGVKVPTQPGTGLESQYLLVPRPVPLLSLASYAVLHTPAASCN